MAQTVIHYPSSSGIVTQWEVDPEDPIDDPATDFLDDIDRSSDESIIESIRRIDIKAFGEPDKPWTVLGISHTPGTTTIEAQDPVTMYNHMYLILWW